MAVTRVLRIDAAHPDDESIDEAAALLRAGGLVAFPTETVYGLGANALDARAVARIFEAKGRPATDPVIVHLASAAALDQVAVDPPEIAHELAAIFWPGALTLILNKRAEIPREVTAGLGTVGVRVPSHPIALRLLQAAGLPIAAPSANRFSRPSPTQADHVITDLDGRIDLVIDGGPTPVGVESTILDLTVTPPLVRRPGGVSLHAIHQLLPDASFVSEALADRHAQPSPGQLLRHYAPRAMMTLYVGDMMRVATRLGSDIRSAVAAGLRVGVLAPEEDLTALAPRVAAVAAAGRVVVSRCGSRRNREEAARELFRTLRALDASGVDVIFAATPAGAGIDAAILDRLTRAAEGRVVRV